MVRMLPIILILAVPLVGGINYLRNEPLDNELKDRPYATISDADLGALIGAYGDDVGHRKSDVDGEPTTTAHNDPSKFGHYDEKVEAFEKFQRTNSDWKQRRANLFEQQATLDELRHEKSIRDRGLHREWKRIWRRVSTF